ncbi:MAG: hypothetical protein JXQ65_05520 [Candidatus Marinimicrobia bacterium]|nr:hypothetical protein [Candidatus Neomarinimicrobiota bacterium]
MARNIKPRILYLIFLILFAPSLCLGNNNNIKLSVASSLFSDNNIYEKINDPKVTDLYYRLGIKTGITLKNGLQHFTLNFDSNVQNYFNYPNENKLFSRINIDYLNLLNKKNFISMTGYYSRKNWFNIDKSYDNSFLNLSYNHKSNAINLSGNFITGHYLFSYFSEFDHFFFGFSPKVKIRKSNQLSYIIFYDIRMYDYLNPFIDQERFDKSQTINLGFEYQNGLIFGTNFQYSHTRSNYDFLGNNSFVIMPYLSAEYNNFYYQIILKWDLKKYQNTINTNQINLIFPDPEANTNNQFYFGVDREITKHLSITGKIIFFASEYRFQDDFYQKFLIGFGLKYDL